MCYYEVVIRQQTYKLHEKYEFHIMAITSSQPLQYKSIIIE